MALPPAVSIKCKRCVARADYLQPDKVPDDFTSEKVGFCLCTFSTVFSFLLSIVTDVDIWILSVFELLIVWLSIGP